MVTGYRRTKATITLLSNRPLKGGLLHLCGKDYELVPHDANSVAATFTIATTGSFSASITDTEGNVTREKLEGIGEVRPAVKPEIAIDSPGRASYATLDAQPPNTLG